MNNKSRKTAQNGYWNITGVVFLAIILPLMMVISTYFPSSEPLTDLSDEYYYQNYSVEATVYEDNSILIEEDMTVYFIEESHGIIRTIPLIQKVSFVDENGKKKVMNYRVEITQIKNHSETSKIYKVADESNYLLIKLGSVLEYKTYKQASERFKISYKISLGDDRMLGMDQFYYNIIGHSFDTKILNSSFTINFFKSIPEDKTVYLYYGKTGESNEIVLQPFNQSRTIYKYTHDKVLNYGEGLTVRVLLPQGFFSVERSYIVDIIILIILLGILFTIIMTFTQRHNKKTLIPVVNFEPPKNMKPTEVGFCIDGKVDNKDIAAMIVYWAEKGYLKIIEQKTERNEDVIYLEKVKNPDEFMTVEEAGLFNSIFSTDKVTVDNLGSRIYHSVQTLKNKIEKENRPKYFNQMALNYRSSTALLTTILLSVISYKIGYFRVSGIAILFGTILSAVWFILISSLINLHDYQYTYTHQYKTQKKFWINLLMIVVLIAYSFVVYEYYSDPLFLTFIACAIAFIGSYLIFKINVRSDEGIIIQGQLLGLREFIDKAEKDRIEMLVKEVPQIFFKILPYAYVLGVSETWIEKFEDIAIDMPDWYQTYTMSDVFFAHLFMSSLDRSFNSLNKAINYTPQTNTTSRGFGGGGGFSGGGFGGGGGSRW